MTVTNNIMNLFPSLSDCIHLFNFLPIFLFINILTLFQKLYYILLPTHQYSLKIYQLNQHYGNIHREHFRTTCTKFCCNGNQRHLPPTYFPRTVSTSSMCEHRYRISLRDVKLTPSLLPKLSPLCSIHDAEA
jgi:hypothetical protein